jgi:hypothetical protein
MPFGEHVVIERRCEVPQPDPGLLAGLLGEGEGLAEDGTQGVSGGVGGRFERGGARCGAFVEEVPCVQQQRPLVREAVEDETGRAPGPVCNGAQGQPLRAVFAQHLPDRVGDARLRLGILRSGHVRLTS